MASDAAGIYLQSAHDYHVRYTELQQRIDIVEALAKKAQPNKDLSRRWLEEWRDKAGTSYKDLCGERDALMATSSHYALMSIMWQLNSK